MGIIESKYSSARDVALALGVPPQLLGIPGDNTYSNYAEARLAFWEDTALPMLDYIIQDWNAWLAAPYGVEIRADVDSIPAIADKRSKLWDMANTSTDLTINERRAMKGYEPIAGGDVLLVSPMNVPLGDMGSSTDAELTADQVKALVYGPKAN
jgi:phage portal protein BeeE